MLLVSLTSLSAQRQCRASCYNYQVGEARNASGPLRPQEQAAGGTALARRASAGSAAHQQHSTYLGVQHGSAKLPWEVWPGAKRESTNSLKTLSQQPSQAHL